MHKARRSTRVWLIKLFHCLYYYAVGLQEIDETVTQISKCPIYASRRRELGRGGVRKKGKKTKPKPAKQNPPKNPTTRKRDKKQPK